MDERSCEKEQCNAARMTRKEFISKATAAETGQKFKIQRAGSWERFIGWSDHYWGSYTFVAFENNTAIFTNDFDPDRKVYIDYKMVKTGAARIIWEKLDVFKINKPIDLQKEKVIKLFEPGVIQSYK